LGECGVPGRAFVCVNGPTLGECDMPRKVTTLGWCRAARMPTWREPLESR
jgi:hypothetical protein